jgi:hypothetical protein
MYRKSKTRVSGDRTEAAAVAEEKTRSRLLLQSLDSTPLADKLASSPVGLRCGATAPIIAATAGTPYFNFGSSVGTEHNRVCTDRLIAEN